MLQHAMIDSVHVLTITLDANRTKFVFESDSLFSGLRTLEHSLPGVAVDKAGSLTM